VDRSRLEAFSDGVFAVAVTLLALNLAVAGPGHGSLGHQLTSHWPSFAAYAVSFFTIGIIWVNHHTLFRTFTSVDRVLVFLNLVLLFVIVMIPFTTSTLASYLRSGGTDDHLAAALYASVLEAMSLAFCAVFAWSIHRRLIGVSLTPAEARAATLRFGLGNAAYIAAIGVAFVSPGATLAISAAVALYYVFDRTPTAPGPVG
jgi:TMEM175 potassium channel family protein